MEINQISLEIKNFVLGLQDKYGKLPKFAHNLVNSNPNKVYYSGPYFDENELTAAIETLLFGKWSSSGEICAKFEREFSKKINNKYSFFCNSGSSANLLMIAACKEYFHWKDGDEIILSSVGFPTTCSCIVQNNLKPVFIDVEWNTLNFDLNKIQEKISNRTRVIFLSSVLGNPPDMDVLLNIIGLNPDIQLLLDDCDSLGSKWRERYLNEYSIASSFSLYTAHLLSTIEGGIVSSNNEEIIKIVKSYATWGRQCKCCGVQNLLPNGSCGKRFSNWLQDFPDLIIDDKYVFNKIGYNLKPLDLQGAIGLEQLKKIDYICKIRIRNQRKIEDLFAKHIDYIRFPKVLKQTEWIPFGVPIICQSKEIKQKLVYHLEKNGIQTRNYFAGNLLMHPGYKHLDDYRKYPEANKVLDLVFFVGCSPTISEENIQYIEKVLKEYND